MTETPQESDQLPEEGPAEQVHDDTGGPRPTESESDSRKRKGEDETATGNPDAAGSEEGDDS